MSQKSPTSPYKSMNSTTFFSPITSTHLPVPQSIMDNTPPKFFKATNPNDIIISTNLRTYSTNKDKKLLNLFRTSISKKNVTSTNHYSKPYWSSINTKPPIKLEYIKPYQSDTYGKNIRLSLIRWTLLKESTFEPLYTENV